MRKRLVPWVATALAAAVVMTALPAVAQTGEGHTERHDRQVRYLTAGINGVDVFYREAGPREAPVVLLLPGFPSSSHMFRDLIDELSGEYRVIAPDYPGFGRSAAPDRTVFAYTFDNYASIIDGLTEHVGAERYALYVFDFGAPVGFRLAAKHPDRVTALVVQNGNAYDEGVTDFFSPIKAYWASNSPSDREALRRLTSSRTTHWRYTHGVPDLTLVDPDAAFHDQAFLDRPGNQEIQLDLFYDYRTNPPLYPVWQAYFRTHRPPTLVVWGANDKIFVAAGAEPYRRDNPEAEIHLLDTGHFALETHGVEIARLMRDFLGRKVRE